MTENLDKSEGLRPFFTLEEAKTLVGSGKVDSKRLAVLKIIKFGPDYYCPDCTVWGVLYPTDEQKALFPTARWETEISSNPEEIIILDLKVLDDFLKSNTIPSEVVEA
jgi:hypothetical protein